MTNPREAEGVVGDEAIERAAFAHFEIAALYDEPAARRAMLEGHPAIKGYIAGECDCPCRCADCGCRDVEPSRVPYCEGCACWPEADLPAVTLGLVGRPRHAPSSP